MSAHSLVLVNRGHPHVHRWRPECTCGGWVGIPRRRRREAVAQYRDHVRQQARRAQQLALAPRECTPADQLPEALR